MQWFDASMSYTKEMFQLFALKKLHYSEKFIVSLQECIAYNSIRVQYVLFQFQLFIKHFWFQIISLFQCTSVRKYICVSRNKVRWHKWKWIHQLKNLSYDDIIQSSFEWNHQENRRRGWNPNKLQKIMPIKWSDWNELVEVLSPSME